MYHYDSRRFEPFPLSETLVQPSRRRR
jgi:hypothetical protein